MTNRHAGFYFAVILNELMYLLNIVSVMKLS